MYTDYCNFVDSLNMDELENINFKTNAVENVSYNFGLKYLDLIQKEFSEILFENIKDYVDLNDKYGKPKRDAFEFDNKILMASSTSLRYLYHALVILKHYENTKCKNIVELGGGYGGLCLAINYFGKLKGIKIQNYHLIDLPQVTNLIKKYLILHKDNIQSEIIVHNSDTYGKKIIDSDLFFISNYCYTEISEFFNKMYSKILLPRVSHGFLVWQNGGNKGIFPVADAENILGKKVIISMDERPQTDAGYGIYKNYFVYF
jgi:hypothetical protein